MSSASKAAEDLKTFANRLKPMMDCAAALEEIGNLENAASEAKIRKDSLYKEADEASKALDQKKLEIKKAEEAIDSAHKEAKNIESSTKIKIDAALKAAAEKAFNLVKEAEDKVASIKSELAQSYDELNQVKYQTQETKAHLEKIKKELSLTGERVLALSNV
jgi:chromosome segregation ATPase